MGVKVFGTSREVKALARVTQLCMEALTEANEKGNSLLSSIEGSESDNVYQKAKEIVDYVSNAIVVGQEPLDGVISALNQYADLLEAHGK